MFKEIERMIRLMLPNSNNFITKEDDSYAQFTSFELLGEKFRVVLHWHRGTFFEKYNAAEDEWIKEMIPIGSGWMNNDLTTRLESVFWLYFNSTTGASPWDDYQFTKLPDLEIKHVKDKCETKLCNNRNSVNTFDKKIGKRIRICGECHINKGNNE